MGCSPATGNDPSTRWPTCSASSTAKPGGSSPRPNTPGPGWICRANRCRRGCRAPRPPSTPARPGCGTSRSSPDCSTARPPDDSTRTTWAGAETQLAAHTGDYTPTQLRAWGAQLIDALDQDGPAPDDPDPVETNELLLTRRPDGGGWLKARFDDAAIYDTIAALIDAHAAPRTAEDTRPLLQRQAEAMAEIFGWVAEHGDPTITPSAGGRRPQVTVHIRLRRAVAARDRGCAHPGCTRPVSWCEIHHIVPWETGGPTTLSNAALLC